MPAFITVNFAGFMRSFFTDNIIVTKGDEKIEREIWQMTNKELLYIEDALGHAQFMISQCQQAAQQLKTPALRQQAQRLIQENQKLFDSFYELV